MRVHCKDCKFWNGPADAHDFHSGACQISPPALITQLDQTGRPVTGAVFVTTKGDTWCGKGEKEPSPVN